LPADVTEAGSLATSALSAEELAEDVPVADVLDAVELEPEELPHAARAREPATSPTMAALDRRTEVWLTVVLSTWSPTDGSTGGEAAQRSPAFGAGLNDCLDSSIRRVRRVSGMQLPGFEPVTTGWG
jgi:hypothetical protein